jgi:RNA polymerase subunit RPABC4/transcription elongation factor Spt4
METAVHTETAVHHHGPGSVNRLSCPGCRKSIRPDSCFCPHCNMPIVRRYCPGCRKLVPEHVQVCPYCGTPADAQPSRRFSHPTALAVAAAVGLSLTLVVAYPGLVRAIKGKAISLISSTPKAVGQPSSTIARGIPMAAMTESRVAAQVEAPAMVDPYRGAELNMQAHSLMKQGRFDEAIPILKQALEAFGPNSAHPSYQYTLYNMGRALRRSGKSVEAIPYLERCLKLDAVRDMARTELELAQGIAVGSAAAGTAQKPEVESHPAPTDEQVPVEQDDEIQATLAQQQADAPDPQ